MPRETAQAGTWNYPEQWRGFTDDAWDILWHPLPTPPGIMLPTLLLLALALLIVGVLVLIGRLARAGARARTLGPAVTEGSRAPMVGVVRCRALPKPPPLPERPAGLFTADLHFSGRRSLQVDPRFGEEVQG